MIDVDVCVVGAGPAGSTAAITLRRAGRTVALVDKAPVGRDKCCGDGLTTGALRRLEHLGLDPGSIPGWQVVETCVIRSASGVVREYPLTHGDGGVYAAVAPRAELDAALVRLAERSGAKLLTGVAVTALEDAPGPGGKLTITGHGSTVVRARVVIGADGMWSAVRQLTRVDVEPGPEPGTNTIINSDPVSPRPWWARPLAAPRVEGMSAGGAYLGEWHAGRQYFANVGPAASRELWVWFDADLLPGYAWSFPLPDGRANVGFGVARTPDSGALGKRMHRLWPELLARPHIRRVLGPHATPEGTFKAWPIPARVDRAPLVAWEGRVLFVGDAARATDPMTGEGIGQALETGELAAKAVASCSKGASIDTAHAGARYRRWVLSSLGIDNRLARRLTRVLAHRRGVDAAVAITGTSAWTRRNFGRWLFEDYPRAALLTPHRWTPGMFTGPGAFRPPGRHTSTPRDG